MGIDVEGIARAILDVQRRGQDLPSRSEQLDEQADRELKRRAAMAAAGLTEARAEALPQKMEMDRRIDEATINARTAQAEAARALADARSNQEPEGTIKQGADGTFYRIVGGNAYPVTTAEAGEDAGGSPLVGRVPGAGSGSQNVIGPTVTMWRDGRSVIVDRRTGQEVGEAPPLAATQQQSGKMAAAEQIVGDLNDPDTISALAMELNAGNTGVIDRVLGGLLVVAGRAGYSGEIGGKSAQSANVYSTQIRGMASILAKSFGESGRLSDQDIERTVQMFPVPGENEEVTRRKLDRIRALIRAIAGSEPGSAVRNSLLVDQAALDLGGMQTPAGVVEPGGGVMAPLNEPADELLGVDEEALMKKYGY